MQTKQHDDYFHLYFFFFQILLRWIENSKIDFLLLQVTSQQFLWSIYYISRRGLVRRTKLDTVEDNEDGLLLDGMIQLGYLFLIFFFFLAKNTHGIYLQHNGWSTVYQYVMLVKEFVVIEQKQEHQILRFLK